MLVVTEKEFSNSNEMKVQDYFLKVDMVQNY
jgi:hypothetical protein